jgi:hypothetical protein
MGAPVRHADDAPLAGMAVSADPVPPCRKAPTPVCNVAGSYACCGFARTLNIN